MSAYKASAVTSPVGAAVATALQRVRNAVTGTAEYYLPTATTREQALTDNAEAIARGKRIVLLASSVFNEACAEGCSELEISQLQLLMKRLSAEMGTSWAHNWDEVINQFDGSSSKRINFKDFLRMIIREPFVSLLPPVATADLQALLSTRAATLDSALCVHDAQIAIANACKSIYTRDCSFPLWIRLAVIDWRRKTVEAGIRSAWLRSFEQASSHSKELIAAQADATTSSLEAEAARREAHKACRAGEAVKCDADTEVGRLTVQLARLQQGQAAAEARSVELQFRLDDTEAGLALAAKQTSASEAAIKELEAKNKAQLEEIQRLTSQVAADRLQSEMEVKRVEDELDKCRAAGLEAERMSMEIQSRLETELEQIASCEGEVGLVYKEINASLEETVKAAYSARDEVERVNVELRCSLTGAEDELRYRKAECERLAAITEELRAVALEQTDAKVEVVAAMSKLKAEQHLKVATLERSRSALEESVRIANTHVVKLQQQLHAARDHARVAQKLSQQYAAGDSITIDSSVRAITSVFDRMDNVFTN